MKLKFQAASLIQALGIVGIIEPPNLTAQKDSGAYLFRCFRRPDGQPWAHVFARAAHQVARAGFALEELEGEGVFTIPVIASAMFSSVPEDTVTIETPDDGVSFTLSLSSSSGLKWDHSTYQPGLIAPCDKDFEVAEAAGKMPFPVAVLRAALSGAANFLPHGTRAERVEEHFNAVQIFDQSDEAWSKGNGHMFCSDSTRTFSFQCPAFEDKAVAVHARHIGKLNAFLARCTSTEINICKGQNMTFAVAADGEQLLGWVHQVKTHTRFVSIASSRDKYVLRVPLSPMRHAIDAAEIAMRGPGQDTVRFGYTHADRQVRIAARESDGTFESFPVLVDHKPDEPSLGEDIHFRVRLADFKSLFADAIGNEVELRLVPLPPDAALPRGGAYVRTVEEVTLDAKGKPTAASTVSSAPPTFACKITRFMPSTA